MTPHDDAQVLDVPVALAGLSPVCTCPGTWVGPGPVYVVPLAHIEACPVSEAVELSEVEL